MEKRGEIITCILIGGAEWVVEMTTAAGGAAEFLRTGSGTHAP